MIERKTLFGIQGEESYIEKLKVIYPAHNFCKLDRTKVNISGTEIRSNPEKNKENIDEIFRRYLEDNHIF